MFEIFFKSKEDLFSPILGSSNRNQSRWNGRTIAVGVGTLALAGLVVYAVANFPQSVGKTPDIIDRSAPISPALRLTGSEANILGISIRVAVP